MKRLHEVESGIESEFGLNNKVVLYFKGYVYVLKDSELRVSILREVHVTPTQCILAKIKCIGICESFISGRG